jgi:predicted RNA-binding Zn ribbon-like protein
VASIDQLLFVDFVNSDWYDGSGNSKDVLDEPGWLAAFARKWLSGPSPVADGPVDDVFGPTRPLLPAGGEGPGVDEKGRALLRDLRTALRQVVDTLSAGDVPSAALVARLQHFLDAGRLHYRATLEPDGTVAMGLEAQPDDAAAIAAAVALSAVEFLAHGDVDRLKQCDNTGCRWVFYDASKNNSRRWCDSRLCGNVDKVRRYRQRARTA